MDNKLFDIVKRPLITEKSMTMVQDNKYTFACDKRANKIEIKNAIEKLFEVKVLSVKTSNVAPKAKRLGRHAGFKAGYKKAVVELAEGNKIDSFDI